MYQHNISISVIFALYDKSRKNWNNINLRPFFYLLLFTKLQTDVKRRMLVEIKRRDKCRRNIRVIVNWKILSIANLFVSAPAKMLLISFYYYLFISIFLVKFYSFHVFEISLLNNEYCRFLTQRKKKYFPQKIRKAHFADFK